MPLDPIVLALQNGRPLSAGALQLAKHRRLERIDELWTEVRILERALEPEAYALAVRAERDPPVEASEHSRH